MIRGFFQTKTTDAHLRMAAIPRGSTLVEAGSRTWPVIKAQTVFVLPGVPEIFKAKFEAIAHFFRRGTWYLRSVYLNEDEGTIARKPENWKRHMELLSAVTHDSERTNLKFE